MKLSREHARKLGLDVPPKPFLDGTRTKGPAKQSANELTKACLRMLELCNVFAWRNNSTGVYDPAKKVFRSFQGLKGTPDIIGILPESAACEGGTFFGAEIKVGDDQLSPHQVAFADRCEAQGGYYLVVRHIDDLAKFLRDVELMT